MGRVCGSGREGVRDGHGARDDAFDGRREATGRQAHHPGGVPEGQEGQNCSHSSVDFTES